MSTLPVAPGPDGEAPLPPPPPPYSLFHSDAVGLATFLGTPTAGAILMAINYRRLGMATKAVTVLAVGLLVSALALGFGSLIPQSVSVAIAMGLFLAMRSAAKGLQGAAVEQHVQQGGKLGSKWFAAALGVGLLALIVGSYVLIDFVSHPKIHIGAKDEVYYTGTATKQDATALAGALKQLGFLTDRGASVFVSKGEGPTAISFVVKEGVWNDPRMVTSFEELGRQLAPAVGGFPIKLRLMNAARDVKKEVNVGRAVIGTKDEIFYFGSATDAEARSLGKALQAAAFFRDQGYSVLLAKGDGTVISFLVKDGFWEQPEKVAAMEQIARQVAPAAGGLPLKLRLLNSRMETQKEIAIQ